MLLALPAPSNPLAIGVTLPPAVNPAAVYLASLATGSRRSMSIALDHIADILSDGRLDKITLPWHQLRYQHAAALRTQLAERFSYKYANLMISALRGVIREAWRLGHIDATEYNRIVDVKGIKGESLPSGRSLSVLELHQLYQACEDGTPLGHRDAALLSVLYGAGLRRSEAAALDLADFDLDGETLKVRSGKGNKDRFAPLAANAAAPILRWVELRGDEPGPLLCPVLRGGTIVVRRMNAQTVMAALLRRGDSVKMAKFSPHDLRRTFAGDLLDAGVDISIVQQVLGHANVSTTQKYDRRTAKTRRMAVKRISVPTM